MQVLRTDKSARFCVLHGTTVRNDESTLWRRRLMRKWASLHDRGGWRRRRVEERRMKKGKKMLRWEKGTDGSSATTLINYYVRALFTRRIEARGARCENTAISAISVRSAGRWLQKSLISFFNHSSHVLHYPRNEFGDSGAYSGKVRLSASDTPRYYAGEKVTTVFAAYLKRTTGVTLKDKSSINRLIFDRDRMIHYMWLKKKGLYSKNTCLTWVLSAALVARTQKYFRNKLVPPGSKEHRLASIVAHDRHRYLFK